MDLSHDLYQHLSRDWNAQTDVKEIPCTVSPAKMLYPHSFLTCSTEPQQLQREDSPLRTQSMPLPLQ